MGTKGEKTREHILATAERLILQRGYSGTSIEEIISEAGITKGGFFYHFDGKNDLAKNLMLRYLDNDVKFFFELAERAQALTEDPLQQLLIFLKLRAEAMDDIQGAHPGCLIASFTYEAQQLDEDVRQTGQRAADRDDHRQPAAIPRVPRNDPPRRAQTCVDPAAQGYHGYSTARRNRTRG